MSNLKPHSILVVEDTPSHRDIIERAFRGVGVSLTFLRDGREAVEYLKENNPDVVLLDWNLPYYDGGEVMQEIRKNRKSPIFIVLTTSKNDQDIKKAYDAGANAYLVKPVLFDQYKELFQNVEQFWFNEQMRYPDKR